MFVLGMGLLLSWLMVFILSWMSLACCSAISTKFPPWGTITTWAELNWAPGQDISSQYLHEPRKIVDIYRTHFCWCRVAVKLISVHTSTGPCGGTELHLEHECTPRQWEGRISLLLPAYLYGPPPPSLFIFFYLFHPSIHNTVRRLSCSSTFLPRWNPIKLGFVCKAAIQIFPAFF